MKFLGVLLIFLSVIGKTFGRTQPALIVTPLFNVTLNLSNETVDPIEIPGGVQVGMYYLLTLLPPLF